MRKFTAQFVLQRGFSPIEEYGEELLRLTIEEFGTPTYTTRQNAERGATRALERALGRIRARAELDPREARVLAIGGAWVPLPLIRIQTLEVLEPEVVRGGTRRAARAAR